MGRVLAARDVVLDVPVALKVVRPSLAADPRFRKLFDLEVRISARFTHPHIVPLHDHGVTPLGTPWLALALADGGSFARFRDEHVSWADLSRLLLELLDALSHLHARGVVHRDLKPENILLHTDDQGELHVWLADLGLANAAKDLARGKGRMVGTPGFMPPEQRMGLPREYGPWTDLYALGVVIWEIATGERPFGDDDAGNKNLPSFEPRPGLQLPAELGYILDNLLNPEPLCRYDLAADLRTELLALGEVVEVSGYQPIVGVSPGTVARSADAHISDVPLVTQEGIEDVPTEEAVTLEMGNTVPEWNRPLPPGLPERPPLQASDAGRAKASLTLFALREPPLIGREDVRAELWSHARAVARERRPRVVLMVGEAGAGKERLVESVLLSLEEGGWAETVRLAWQEQENADDGYVGAARALLRPWNESRASLVARLRRRLSRERGRYDAEIRQEADTLVKWCGLLEEGEDPVAGGIGLREIYRHLDARTWRGLSCLALHDVGWARDEGDGLDIAEALLASETAGVSDKPLLVIATLRREDLHADPQLATRVDALVASGAHRMDLPRLTRSQTLELLEQSLRLAPALAERVVERCEGNPLFARQMLLEWSSRGWLVDTGGLTFDLAPGVDASSVLPRDAEDLFGGRVERLCQSSGNDRRFRDAVHMAALAGRTLPRDLVIGLGGDELAEFIRGCGLWVERDDKMSFDSSLLHEVVHGHARARKDVAYLHRRLGRLWAKHGEESGADVAMAAGRHAMLGRDWQLAAEQLLDAAERAWMRGQSHDLDESSRMGFEVVREHQELWEHWGRAALLRGHSLQMQGDAAAAAKAFTEALQALRKASDPREPEAWCGQGWCSLKLGQLDRAEQAYAQAVERGRSLGDPRAEAVAIAGKAWVEQQRRNFDGADILFTRAVNQLARADEIRELGSATLGQAFVARRTGQLDEAVELYAEAADAFREGEDPIGEGRSELGRAVTLRQQGAFEASEVVLRETMSMAERLGAMNLLMDVRLALADLERVQGDLQRARRMYGEHIAWATGQHAFEEQITGHMGMALLALSDENIDEAYEQAQEMVVLLEQVPGHWLWASYRLVVATLLALRGEPGPAWEWLWSAEELGIRDTVDMDTAWCLERILAVSDGRSDRWDRVRKLAAKLVVPQLYHLGRPEDARRIQQAHGS